MPAPPSGAQFEIAAGSGRATIVEVGGGIRSYEDGGRAVLEPYGLADICDGGHGAVLVPWPNRLAEGRYSFQGVEHRLALTEPARGNAIHGLGRWRAWRALEQEPDRVLMGLRLHPQPGYPFDLEVAVEYRMGEDGLTVTTTALNRGGPTCPYGAGQHPYLSPGAGTIDDCSLELPAATLITTDPDSGLPSGREGLEGRPLDFRSPRRLAELQIDSPFADLDRGADGRARARLLCADGASVELWVDDGYSFLELFTGDTLSPSRRRRGLAVEPMSCPPNAFQSGEGLVRLGAGDSHTARWGVALRR